MMLNFLKCASTASSTLNFEPAGLNLIGKVVFTNSAFIMDIQHDVSHTLR